MHSLLTRVAGPWDENIVSSHRQAAMELLCVVSGAKEASRGLLDCVTRPGSTRPAMYLKDYAGVVGVLVHTLPLPARTELFTQLHACLHTDQSLCERHRHPAVQPFLGLPTQWTIDMRYRMALCSFSVCHDSLQLNRRTRCPLQIPVMHNYCCASPCVCCIIRQLVL